jgi:hypothetical protein
VKVSNVTFTFACSSETAKNKIDILQFVWLLITQLVIVREPCVAPYVVEFVIALPGFDAMQ